jgi:hypothetical protein
MAHRSAKCDCWSQAGMLQTTQIGNAPFDAATHTSAPLTLTCQWPLAAASLHEQTPTSQPGAGCCNSRLSNFTSLTGRVGALNKGCPTPKVSGLFFMHPLCRAPVNTASPTATGCPYGRGGRLCVQPLRYKPHQKSTRGSAPSWKRVSRSMALSLNNCVEHQHSRCCTRSRLSIILMQRIAANGVSSQASGLKSMLRGFHSACRAASHHLSGVINCPFELNQALD